MKTTTENSNNGAGAGGALKSTAATTEKEKITLSAEGMTSLLKSEFATEAAGAETAKAGSEGAQEIPAQEEKEEAGEGAENTEGGAAGEAGEAAAGEAAAGEVAGEHAEGETKVDGEGETKTGEEAGAAGELPEALQTELTEWESKGGPLPGGLQALVDKRIGKLTGEKMAEKTRADRAEAELNATKAERDALRNDPSRPAHLTPAPVMGEKELNDLADTAKTFVSEAENYLDDSATEEERARVEKFMASERLDAKGLKRRIRETQAFITQDLPAQRVAAAKFREGQKAAEPVVAAQMPWLNDKASPEYAQAQTVLALMPELQSRTPAHRVAVGTYVLGLKVLNHLAQAGVATDSGAALTKALATAFPIGAAAGKAPVVKPNGAPPKTPAGKSATAAGAAATKARVPGDEAARQQFNKAPTKANATELARQGLLAA